MPSTRGRSALHAGLFVALLAFATLALAELVFAVALGRSGGRIPARDEIQRSLNPAASESTASPGTERAEERRRGQVLHPYLGFVRNSEIKGERRVNRLLVPDPVNEYGFFGPSPLAPLGADRVRVAITGGSVAEELYLYGRGTLARELEASGAFGDRTVEIVSLAVAGFKQPQQMLALSYFQVLGAEIDLVINLDGFNEVVLPYTDNVPLAISPIYPFRWRAIAAHRLDPEAALLLGQVSETERGLEQLRSLFGSFPLRHSAVMLATWHLLAQRNEARRAELEGALRQRLGDEIEPTVAERGPPFLEKTAEALFVSSVGIWATASAQMWKLCEAHDTLYLHALQPSQYLAGSKPLTSAERRVALTPEGNSTRVGAELGFPMLVDAGRQMAEQGVPFTDLTDVFAQVDDSVYRDRCCHLLENGYQIVARRLASDVAELVEATNTELRRVGTP